jgi:hypothetical protein
MVTCYPMLIDPSTPNYYPPLTNVLLFATWPFKKKCCIQSTGQCVRSASHALTREDRTRVACHRAPGQHTVVRIRWSCVGLHRCRANGRHGIHRGSRLGVVVTALHPRYSCAGYSLPLFLSFDQSHWLGRDLVSYRVCIRVCVCLCIHTYLPTYIHTYIHTYIFFLR